MGANIRSRTDAKRRYQSARLTRRTRGRALLECTVMIKLAPIRNRVARRPEGSDIYLCWSIKLMGQFSGRIDTTLQGSAQHRISTVCVLCGQRHVIGMYPLIASASLGSGQSLLEAVRAEFVWMYLATNQSQEHVGPIHRRTRPAQLRRRHQSLWFFLLL